VIANRKEVSRLGGEAKSGCDSLASITSEDAELGAQFE